MRIIFLSLVLSFVLFAACSKPNPALCCVDEADCGNVGLSEVKGCDEGLICRANQCIAEICETSAECDPSAPYCIAELERCQESCTGDSQCPGFGQATDQMFCEAGDCVECRSDMADCSGATPICEAGACVACRTNDQCGSGVCTDDGTCADATTVAYVAPNGAASSDCTEAEPCSTLDRALALTPQRPFIVIESGTYSRGTTLTVAGGRRLIGRGPTRPLFRRATAGPIALVQGASNVSFEFLDLSNATGTTARNETGGHGILCLRAGGAPVLTVVDSVLQNNMGAGVEGVNCTLEARRSTFNGNAYMGIELVDSAATIDGCVAMNNAIAGMNLDSGVFTVVNSLVARNVQTGIQLFSMGGGQRIELNTIVDNGTGGLNVAGFNCMAPGGSFANNIIARNPRQTVGNCNPFPNSIIVDTDIAPIMFVSPDAAPFDYHIKPGSIAIDAATITTVATDIDGDPRPSDAADVGADELP